MALQIVTILKGSLPAQSGSQSQSSSSSNFESKQIGEGKQKEVKVRDDTATATATATGMDTTNDESKGEVVTPKQDYWGDDIYYGVCSLICGIIQNNPSSLKLLHAANVTQVFLDTLSLSMMKTDLVLRAIPETVRSICLHSQGLTAVIQVSFL
jgi:uncharacterized protein YegJ (DUF2314 family)